jgi:hypothetical protein
MVRENEPAHKLPIPPSATIALHAAMGPSVVLVTRHLMDSRGVPPVKSDATRRKAPRANVFSATPPA